MAYIDTSYLNDVFGSTNVTALCPTAGEVAGVIAAADALVHAVLYGAGYQTDSAPSSLTPSTTPEIVKQASFGAWLELAHLRNRKELPELAKTYTGIRTQIKDGLEISGLTKTVARAIGGVTRPDVTSSRADGGRPPVFDGDGMDGWF